MKTICKTLSLSVFIFFATAITVSAQTRKTRKRATPPVVVNIPMVVDSALIMADDYATALEQKPELASIRLNAIKNFYAAIPSAAACDSVRSRIFDFYVNYVEAGKSQQADAFKQCFLALAHDNDEHLGQIYANDLVLAREHFDTTALKTNIDLLSAYAMRKDYDFDEELAEAHKFLHTIRTRPHINDVLPGVWVSEDICESKKEYGGVLDEAKLISSLKILRIRDPNKIMAATATVPGIYVYGLDSMNLQLYRNKATSGYNLDAVKIRGRLTSCYYTFGGEYGYIPAPILEAYGSNMNIPVVEKPLYVEDTKSSVSSSYFYSRIMRTDNEAYAAYIYWGDERLKVPNAEVGAIIRQTTQASQALVAGQLSRSQYSFGDRLVGNLVSNIISAEVNALVDALMVSKDKIWGIHLVIEVVTPYKLHAQVFAQLVESRSDSPTVSDVHLMHEYDYYRWEPQDSVFFLGDNMSNTLYIDALPLHAITKAQHKEYRERVKVFCKEVKANRVQYCKQREQEIKAMPKGDERKFAAKELKEYRDSVKYRKIWNERALAKLKAKSDRYDSENQ